MYLNNFQFFYRNNFLEPFVESPCVIAHHVLAALFVIAHHVLAALCVIVHHASKSSAETQQNRLVKK